MSQDLNSQKELATGLLMSDVLNWKHQEETPILLDIINSDDPLLANLEILQDLRVLGHTDGYLGCTAAYNENWRKTPAAQNPEVWRLGRWKVFRDLNKHPEDWLPEAPAEILLEDTGTEEKFRLSYFDGRYFCGCRNFSPTQARDHWIGIATLADPDDTELSPSDIFRGRAAEKILSTIRDHQNRIKPNG